ncbi:MAG TPA: DUF4376 domain-containing protein [Azospirillaceae bacterium]|nr:DUF4376 domain-containing protein [Azospirillaceae bacterium]
MTTETLAAFGVDAVFPGAQPTLGRYEAMRRVGPVLDEAKGIWEWRHEAHDYRRDMDQAQLSALLEARRAEMRTQVTAQREARMAAGYEHDFGAREAELEDGTVEPAGIRRLQTRPEDQLRWTTLGLSCLAEMSAGRGDAPVRPLKTADNAEVPVTAAEAFTVVTALQGHMGQILDRERALKKAIARAASLKALDATQINEGWPGEPETPRKPNGKRQPKI